jgi:hypothetical protein
MQIYRLEPKGDTSDRNWTATTLKEKCWVLADSSNAARQIVAFSTGIGSHFDAGAEPIPSSPWLDGNLTNCVPDNAPEREPRHGFIVTASRKIPIHH